jgi:hypothetical protein
MGKEALGLALSDASIDFTSVDGAVVGYNYGDAGSGFCYSV